ncbi:hypothetical protein ACLOAV_002795 [Pseudogymnoascus australis]
MADTSPASYKDVLPDTIKPTNYAISLHDIAPGGAFTYQGTVSISAKILKPTKSITLNSIELKIHSAEVTINNDKTQQTVPNIDVTYDVPKQRVTLDFAGDLPVTNDALIVIKFEGILNDNMAGFYRSKYKPVVPAAASVVRDADNHYMFSTQFESCDARRAFPCFDEPNLKATFDVEIELPEDQVVLSNMPEKSVKKSKKEGLQIVTFERTPIMSTYLLAWAVGDFEYVEAFTERKYNGKNLPVRVYTTKGLKEQGSYALEHAHQIIDYFSEIFGIDYPLPKADLLAVHEFSHGAMENWGLVTYRTTAVLFDEKTSDAKYKNRVAYVVAHELAHQWFGNLVTMDWWSELWLNEGFATWVGWLATDKLHPEWNVWPQFVQEGMQTAFGLDSLRSSHPIEVPVKDALDVDQIFDHISYLKGSSVIRMLASHLGQDKFLAGVGNYLKAHAYGNATTNDLWSALSEVSGQDVAKLMDPWIRDIGYPVVTVSEEPGQISVTQSRCLSTGDVKPEDDKTTWWVPLGLKSKSGTKAISFTTKKETIPDIDDSFYKLNDEYAGFYRTNYPASRLATLSKQLDLLSISDKINLIGDAGALARSGDAQTAPLLSLIEGFSAETNYLVWSQVISSIATVKSVFSEDENVSNALKKFTLKLIKPTVTKLGWTFAPDEDHLTGQLRALLIHSAGMNGDEDVIKEAQRQFYAYAVGDSSAIHNSLKSAVFQINVKYGGRAAYNAVKAEWENTTSIDGKETSLRALGRIEDIKSAEDEDPLAPNLLKDLLDFMANGVPTQDVHTPASTLGVNPKTRLGLWTYIKENWEPLRERLGKNMVVLDRFLKLSLQNFSDLETEADIAAFFADKDNRGYDRTLGVVSDSIKGRASYRLRDAEPLLEWLKANQYA